MKTILVASDFSAEAKNASSYIMPLAQAHKYRVVLFSLKNLSVHALNARLPSVSIDTILKEEKSKVEKAAAALAAQYEVEVIPHFASGFFYEELQQCIDEHQAMFVVMGMAGKSIDQDLLGNTTTTAINKLQVPILAVPRNARFNGIKRILYACDKKRGIHQKVLDSVRLVAHEMGAEVEVFYVNDEMDKLLTETRHEQPLFQHELTNLHISYKDVFSTRIIESIKEELEQSQADLLIMVPYRYGFWNSLVHRSKTRMMAYGSNIPLLSIPLG